MPVTYTFNGRDLRVVFIDDKPWFVGEDLAPCIGLEPRAFADLTRTCTPWLETRHSLIVEVLDADGAPTPTRLYSLKATIHFASAAPLEDAFPFRKWLEDIFDLAAVRAPKNCAESPREARSCPQLYPLTLRLDRIQTSVTGMIQVLEALESAEADPRAISLESLMTYFAMLRDEIRASENIVTFACRCANGQAPF